MVLTMGTTGFFSQICKHFFVHFCKKVGDSDLVLLGKTWSSKMDEQLNLRLIDFHYFSCTLYMSYRLIYACNNPIKSFLASMYYTCNRVNADDQ